MFAQDLPKCAYGWHFNFKPRGGPPWRFSLDVELGKHLESKTEAEKLAGDIRTAINAGTYVRPIAGKLARSRRTMHFRSSNSARCT